MVHSKEQIKSPKPSDLLENSLKITVLNMLK